jgi:hypothetical protein
VRVDKNYIDSAVFSKKIGLDTKMQEMQIDSMNETF